MTTSPATRRAAVTVSDSPRRRSTRKAASLVRFRYREDSDDEDDKTVVKQEKDRQEENDSYDSGGSSLSEVSFHSDIEDAVVNPRQRAAAKSSRKGITVATTTTTTTTTIGTAGKRKRALTVTTTTTDFAAKRRGATAAAPKVKQEEDIGLQKAIIKAEEDSSNVRDVLRTPRKATRKPARVVTTKTKRVDGGDVDVVTVEPPTDWEMVYDLVKVMRQPGGPAANAAVDTMGCERLALASASERDRRLHTLVALMLSSQTKDTVNAVVMARLQTELPPYRPGAPAGLNLDNLLAVAPATLNTLIYQVGFHNNKTRYLKQTAEILRDQYNGDIPPTAEGLMALPGVGPKMAYLCLAAEHGWNRVEGIGVDVHVHRITNLWGWQKPGTPAAKTPEGTRLSLQSWLPRDKWKEINWLLVGFGQSVCLPQGARCGDCTLGLRGLCRAANRKKVAEGRERLELQGVNWKDDAAGLVAKKEDDE